MKTILLVLFLCLNASAQYSAPPLPANASQETGGNLASIINVNAVSGTVTTIPAGGSTWPVSFSAASSQVVTPQNGAKFGTYPIGSSTWPVSLASAPTTPVTGTFWQATQPVSGVGNFTVTPSGASTFQTNIINASLPVTGSFYQATQPVSISTMPSTPVTGSFYQVTQPVSYAGGSTIPVSLASMPTTPVTGAFYQTTQPVSGVGNFNVVPNGGNFSTVPAGNSTWPVSLASAPVTSVTGTFWQTTQPVSYAGGSTVPVYLSSVPVHAVIPYNGTGSFSTVPASGSTWPVSISSMPSTPVTGSFWQATQPVTYAGTSTIPVSIATMPSTPVTGTFFQSTQPVSGVGNFNVVPNGGNFSTVPAGNSTWPVSIASMPSTPVTGTFFQTAQAVIPFNGTGSFSTVPAASSTWPVSIASVPTHPVTYAGGSTIPVSLANNYASATMSSGSGNLDISCEGMGGATVSITGTWTGSISFQQSNDGITFSGAGSVPANSVDLSALSNNVPLATSANGSFSFNTSGVKTLRMKNSVASGSAVVALSTGIGTRVIDAILATVFVGQSGTWTVQPGNTPNSTAWKVDNSAVIQPTILGTSTGKTMISKTGTVSTTSPGSANILTYTTTAGKTFYMNFLNVEGRLSVISATGASIGTVFISPPVGSSLSHILMNPTTSSADRVSYTFSEPWVSAAASVFTISVTPGSSTSTIWRANFGGYEK